MAVVALTDQFVKAARTHEEKRLEVWDSICPGLMLRVTDRGLKTWSFRYRSLDGRQRRHIIGPTTSFSLKAARVEVGRLRALLTEGVDPVQEKREARVQAVKDAQDTFAKLTEAYFAACAAGEWQPKRKIKKPAVLAYERRLSDRHVLPVLGRLPHVHIKRADVKDLLRGMVAKGIRAQTNRVQAIVRQVFNFAISEDLAETNPATGFQSFHSNRPRRRIWSDAELKRLWHALTTSEPLKTEDGAEVHVGREVRIALQLAALLLQRRNEIAGMALEELNLEQAVWVIAPERMKGSRPHQVPLPPEAIRLIEEAIALANLKGRTVGPVFPGPRDHQIAMKPEALTRAMSRLRPVIGVDGASVHDLRRTGSTALTSERIRVSPFIRSKVLGHDTDAGGGAQVSSAHYDVNEYMTDKRAALRAWETLLLRVVSEDARPGPSVSRTGMVRGMVFGLEVANDISWPSHLHAR